MPKYACTVLGLFAAVGLLAAPASAHSVTLGPLSLTDLWSRATPPKAPAAAGYLTITNNGSEPDRLVAVETPAAARSELHIMEVKDGVMTMHPVEGGIAIPAGGTVTLAPGGLHLMFMALKQGLTEGDELPVTLTFERAGKTATYLHVMAIGAQGPGAANNPAMNMDHTKTGTGQ